MKSASRAVVLRFTERGSAKAAVAALGAQSVERESDASDGEAKRLQPGHSGRQWAAPQPGGR